MEKIPCKNYEQWSENQSPLGSGLSWPMEMTGCAKEDDEKVADYGECNEGCPAYEPMEVSICEKHGEFIKQAGCDGCMYDGYLEAEKAAKEYYGAGAH